jgi:glycosyltransferase involved in cell wall biosynthesis
MTARFFDQKDHNTVIRAVTLLNNNVHVLFCGSGDDGINDCRLLADKLGVGERIHFLGGRTDIPKLLKSSDIGILSSFYEGFSISLIEYMASGLPVICSNVDGSRELVKNYGVLFPVGDYNALAKEIGELLENKEYYNEIALKCYNRVQDYDENKMINNYIILYKELLCKTN